MSQLRQLLVAHTGYSAWGTRQVLDSCAHLTPEQIAELKIRSNTVQELNFIP